MNKFHEQELTAASCLVCLMFV